MTEYVKTYQCPECGVRASGRGHLCHPVRNDMPYVCGFCNRKTDDPRHVCSTMVENIEYVCKKCGRMAVYDSLLCEPEPIDNE